jgi:hypothetical protein
MSIRVPDRALRLSFATILFLSGLKLIDVPYATKAIAVAAIGAFALLVTWSVRRLVLRRPAPAAE